MSKRRAESTHESRLAKQQNVSSGTEAEAELLGEGPLPAATMLAWNERIDHAVKAAFPNGLLKGKLGTFYEIIQQQSQGHLLPIAAINDANPHFWMNNHDLVCEMLREAYKAGDYSGLLLIKQLRAPEIPAAWKTPFIGDSHTTLLANLRNMYKRSLTEIWDSSAAYLCHTSIIQSSGSGKSRMVDEVSKVVFTLPFNLSSRNHADKRHDGWPPPDDTIRSLLLTLLGTADSEAQLSRRYLCFFRAVFEETADEVRLLQRDRGCRDPEEMASTWHDYLSSEGHRARSRLYAGVVARTNDLINKWETKEKQVNALVKAGKLNAADAPVVLHEEELRIGTSTREALAKLVSLVSRETHSSFGDIPVQETGVGSSEVPSVAGDNPQDRQGLHVLIYFDGPHDLAVGPVLQGGDKLPLDVLVQALEKFHSLGAFTVVMSTQLRLQYLPAVRSSFPRSARYRTRVGYLHAPITETPFDSFDSCQLIPSRMKADDVGNVAFMACFGRPLWRAMMCPYSDQELGKYTDIGSSAPASPISQSGPERNKRERELLLFARAKLLCCEILDGPRCDYTRTAQGAVLDARIALTYEASSHSAQRHQVELVASHMRTVYSIPRDREYLRSGYSSEPILVEAAARQLAIWREREKKESGQNAVEPAVTILLSNLEHDLLAYDEIGETVGRLLLLLARDHAAEASPTLTSSDGSTHFSRPVSVEAFLRALFPEIIAERVLDSVPDNQLRGEGTKTFREVFKDAVLNFTHYAKLADGSALTEEIAVECFIRHMGLICRNNDALRVDAFLPILMDRSAPLGPEVMSGIFIHFKQPGTRAAYAIDEEDIGFFSPKKTNADGRTWRPYVTLTMELAPAPKGDSTSSSIVQEPPSELFISDLQVSADEKPAVHPRYNMSVYGCSHEVYNVISETEQDIYEQIIRRGDILGEHPRQDAESLDLVRRQKPFFSRGYASWHWIDNDFLNPESGDDMTAGEEFKVET